MDDVLAFAKAGRKLMARGLNKGQINKRLGCKNKDMINWCDKILDHSELQVRQQRSLMCLML